MNKLLSAIRDSYEKQPIIFAVLLITVCVVLSYSNSFTADWHYDDFHHIKENINIRKVSNIPVFFKDPTTFSRNPSTAMYRPLLMTTHALNYRLGILTTRDGYNVVGYHVFNLFLHVLASLAVFFIVHYLFQKFTPVKNINPTLPGIFAALLFGLHTLNTETIVYVSSRSTGMSTAFALWAMYWYMRASDSGKTTHFPLLILSVVTFTCGLLSKEIAFMLLAMIIYYEFFIHTEWKADLPVFTAWKTVFIRWLPFAVSGIAYLYVRHLVRGENLVERLFSEGGSPAAKNLASQLATQARVQIVYIREMLWPTGLSIDKPFMVSKSFGELKVILSLVVIIGIVALAWRVRKRYPLVAFGVFWIFTAHIPTAVYRLNVVLNDHRVYLPIFGFVLIFTIAAARLYVRFRDERSFYSRLFVALSLAVLILMGLGTFKRNAAFATEETMWKDVILKDKKSVRGYNNLGIYYEQHKEYDKALAHYKQTIRLAPMFPNPYINIGNVYHKKKEFKAAENWMKKALQLNPNSALASYNLGNILREAGKTREAIGAYNKALQLNPRYIEAANNLANIYFKHRNYPQAIEYYERALFIDPTFAMSYYNIALANENLGQLNEAIANYEKFLHFWLGEPKYIQLAQKKIETLKGKR
jgi:tetratricopeptide (TPR) repeat protein